MGLAFGMPTLPPASLAGVQIFPTSFGDLPAIKAAGFGLIRVELPWEVTEPRLGVYDFKAYDALMLEATKLGFRVIFILAYGHPVHGKPLDAPEAYAKWLGAVKSRYSRKGIVWEVWNEPNHPKWRIEPAAFKKLVEIVAFSMKGELVITGGLAPRLGTNGEIDWAYAAAAGFGTLPVAGYGIHPYRQKDPDSLRADYAEMKARWKGPILATEMGYSCLWTGESKGSQVLKGKQAIQAGQAVGVQTTLFCWSGKGRSDGESAFGLVDFPAGYFAG